MEYQKALYYGAQAKGTLKVTHEDGTPIKNANVRAFFKFPRADKGGYTFNGLTDENGLFVVANKTAGAVYWRVEKESYYQSLAEIISAQGYDPERLKDGRWLPWNPTIPLVLRDIRNPIPMYVKRVDGKFPKNQVVGFDCEKGDFVAPHGHGEVADFTIQISGDGIDNQRWNITNSLDSVDVDGGFQVLKRHNYSGFKSEYLAPESGYATNITVSWDYLYPEGTHISGRQLVYEPDGEYLVFKSRIKRDDEGNVISANYGKMYGDFRYGAELDGKERALLKFTYYFNPTPNDRNIEFDCKDPLFKTIDWRYPHPWPREP